MADLFLSPDVCQILLNKYVVIMGDSVQRSIYKDLVCVLQQNQYMNDKQLRCKGDVAFMSDRLIEGGKMAKLHNGAGYREEREYHTDYHLVKFFFVTRCYYNYVECILNSVKNQCILPDVFILNSCLWDISRYGPTGVAKYIENMKKLVKMMKSVLPKECLVIWNTTLPISDKAKGGFLVPEIEHVTNSLHLDILEANHYCTRIFLEAGYDVLDLHYHLRNHVHRRAEDGIHWDMTAHRRITNILLNHISQAWGQGLPGNVPAYLSADKNPNSDSFVSNDYVNTSDSSIPVHITERPKKKAKRKIICKIGNDQSQTPNPKNSSANKGMNSSNKHNDEIGASLSSPYHIPSSNGNGPKLWSPILPPLGRNGHSAREGQKKVVFSKNNIVRNSATLVPPYHTTSSNGNGPKLWSPIIPPLGCNGHSACEGQKKIMFSKNNIVRNGATLFPPHHTTSSNGNGPKLWSPIIPPLRRNGHSSCERQEKVMYCNLDMSPKPSRPPHPENIGHLSW